MAVRFRHFDRRVGLGSVADGHGHGSDRLRGHGRLESSRQQGQAFDDITPSFAEVAAGREARAREAEQFGYEVTARESFLVASIYYGVAQWPIDEISELNLQLNAKKLDC